MHDASYVLARRVLLDAIEALGAHQEQVILVGAQAVYFHTRPDDDIAVVPFTRDADLLIDPTALGDDPRIEACMRAAGFTQRPDAQPGAWHSREGVEVDLMVPDAVAGPGSRSARVPPHDPHAMRRARGLEGALVDHELQRIEALDPADDRTTSLRVAGPAALLISKAIKLDERLRDGRTGALPKDALDVLRLLRTIPTHQLATAMNLIRLAPASKEVARVAIDWIRNAFSSRDAEGSRLLHRALEGSSGRDVALATAPELVVRLMRAIDAGGDQR